MKIKYLKEKYKGEWLAIRVTKEKDGRAIEGELIDSCKDKKEIWGRVIKIKEKGIYITYGGPPLKEGYAAAFSVVKIDSAAPIIVLDTFLGKNRYRVDMALDTGASYVMLPLYVAEYLNYDVILGKKIPIATVSGVEKVPLIKIDKIPVAEVTKRNIEAICHDMPPESPVQGLIGLSFLRNLRTIVDLKKGYIKIEN